ncbi:MAG: class I SAM-dependent methyltransferase [Sphingobacteriales bacterium]|nr:class I SAM-dependent methyltransferase [Sphingobacteriales bacterium]OJY84473.1 MAG: hypothetical protein BGP14_19755 [Sphingobacteriales bacterium 44-15]
MVTPDPEGKRTLEVISKAEQFNQWLYTEIRPFLSGKILEIGSGLGNISKFVIRDNYNITLSDYNEDYYYYLKKKYQSDPNVADILQIDLLHHSFEEEYLTLKNSFDTIFLLNVIEHVEDDEKALKNLGTLLKKNGNLILLAPAFNWLYCRFDRELGHYRRYTKKSMGELLSDHNFNISCCRYFNAAGIPGWFIFGKLLNRKLIGKNEMSLFNYFVFLFKIIDKILSNTVGLSVISCSTKKE